VPADRLLTATVVERRSFGDRLLAPTLLVLVFAVFAVTLRGASIYDDAVEIQQMAEVAMRDAWSLRLNGYYRPLRTVAWLAVRDGFGWFSPAMLHWMNLAAHTAGCALVYRLTRRRLGGFGAATASAVFAFFPWSYEAVLWAAAVNHPAMHACGLGALACLSVRRVDSRAAAAGSALIVAALLLHELAVLYVGLAFGVVMMRRLRRRWDSGRKVIAARANPATYVDWAPVIVGGIVFALLRLFVPATTATRFDADPVRLIGNWVLLLQGPAAPWVVLFRSGLGVLGLPADAERNRIIAASATLTFVSTLAPVLALRRGRAIWATGFLIWFVFSAAISASLTVEYLATSPRMHYAGAVGIALCVGAAVSAVWRRSRVFVRGVVAASLVVWAVWCIRYIDARGLEAARLGAALRTIAADVAASAPESRFLVLNFPFWNAPRYPAFLMGNEGLQIYQEGGSGPDGFLFAQNGVRRPTWFHATAEAESAEGAFRYEPYRGAAPPSLHEVTHIYRFEYDEPGVRVRRVAVQDSAFARAIDDRAPQAVFHARQDDVAALRLTVRKAVECGTQVDLELDWTVLDALPADVTVFVHVYDGSGVRLVAADADPADGLIALGSLLPDVDRPLREQRSIRLPAVGAADVHLGVYRRSDGGRLIARSADGVDLPGGEFVVALDRCE